MARSKRAPTGFTHLDAQGRPVMVDVAGKAVTARSASAAAELRFPSGVAEALRAQGMRSGKGAVLDTAIVAGTQAVKNTAQLIPFCHPLAIEGCAFEIGWCGDDVLRIVCTVRITGKTGVEMEALTGAGVAALTVYDMCKALSHDIVIAEIRLLAKRGGKRTVGA